MCEVKIYSFTPVDVNGSARLIDLKQKTRSLMMFMSAKSVSGKIYDKLFFF